MKDNNVLFWVRYDDPSLICCIHGRIMRLRMCIQSNENIIWRYIYIVRWQFNQMDELFMKSKSVDIFKSIHQCRICKWIIWLFYVSLWGYLLRRIDKILIEKVGLNFCPLCTSRYLFFTLKKLLTFLKP